MQLTEEPNLSKITQYNNILFNENRVDERRKEFHLQKVHLLKNFCVEKIRLPSANHTSHRQGVNEFR